MSDTTYTFIKWSLDSSDKYERSNPMERNKYVKHEKSNEDKLLQEFELDHNDRNMFSKETNNTEDDMRDFTNERLEKREKYVQSNMNPFHIGRDYLSDLNVQDNFLKPQDSNTHIDNEFESKKEL